MRTLLLAVAGILTLSVAASASFIPGANNEILNGEFENGFLNWEHVQGEVWISNYGHVGNSAQCDLNTNGWGDHLRQVIDDSTGNLWDPNLHAKIVDLEAWVSIDVKHNQEGGVRFRLDWFDESFNALERDQLPAYEVAGVYIPGYYVTPWVEYRNNQGYGTPFTYVNPFNRYEIRDVAGNRIQPRWISVEIEFWQPDNVINRVDSVVLTSECVPEPSVLVALLSSLAGLGALRAFKRK